MSARHRILFAALLCAVANAYGDDNELSPAMQARRLMLAGKHAQDEKKPGEAVAAYDKLVALKQPLPNEFWYFYAVALRDTQRYADARAALISYLRVAGEHGINFESALLLLDAVEKVLVDKRKKDEELAANERARMRMEEEQKSLLRAFLAENPPIRDCDSCPLMVPLPAGQFKMGTPLNQPGRVEAELAPRAVAVQPFMISRFEITRAEFSAFATQTQIRAKEQCMTLEDGVATVREKRSWKSPGFEQSDENPVTCISWSDAQAYVNWLSMRTGRNYWVPSELEWEYAARAGDDESSRYWGNATDQQCRFENGADLSLKASDPSYLGEVVKCDDGASRTAKVGSYLPNAFGLHDMLGNVSEWTHDTFVGTKTDPLAWMWRDGSWRVIKGGSWWSGSEQLRAGFRGGANAIEFRGSMIGFRVAASNIRRPTRSPESGNLPSGKLGVLLRSSADIVINGVLRVEDGVQLESVREGSGAWQAGIRAGDHVLTIGGVPTLRGEDIVTVISRYKSGDVVNVGVRRGASISDYQVILQTN